MEIEQYNINSLLETLYLRLGAVYRYRRHCYIEHTTLDRYWGLFDTDAVIMGIHHLIATGDAIMQTYST